MTSAASGRMRFRPGERLGPYEIASLIGAGGMGEVYRARDTRLGRDVAIKVVAAIDAAADPSRLRRFEQEARTVAALDHPNILSVHDVGTEAGAPYLVFELLDGESLRDRMARGPVSPQKALDWAGQIARGLAAAHDRGVVHRDVKPENLFVTREGRVKILDFGLAKLLLGEDTVAQAEGSATQTSPGTLLGTVGYMSPEQVRGQAVDGRADIFSLGAVLYEMLSGRRAFRGNTNADTLIAILKEDPPELAVPAAAPRGLPRIVKRCLEKVPEERFQSTRDLAFDLETLSGAWDPSPPSPSAARRRPGPGAVLAATLMGAIALASFVAGRRAGSAAGQGGTPKTPPTQIRFQMTPPSGLRRVDAIRLSPDGTRLVFLATAADGKSQLWLRSLSSIEVRPLPGTEAARGTPFWSPDSRSIAFFDADELKRIDVSGGSPQMLCLASPKWNVFESGAWSRDGVVIFSTGTDTLYRVSASGGAVAPVTVLDAARQERKHAFPQFLPDGRHFLYWVSPEDPQQRAVRVGSLDSKETRPLLPADGMANDAWSGHVLFRRGRALLAQGFDAERLALTGEPFAVADSVDFRGFSASPTGVLAFLSTGPDMTQLTWLDRAGKRLGTVGEAGPYVQFALSPDERLVALQRVNPRLETADIWLLDLKRGVVSPFTFDPGSEADPVWSPDGGRLAFDAEGEGKGRLAIFQKDLGGTAEERVLPESAARAYVEDWSRDGRFLFYGAGMGGRDGLWAIPLFGDRKPFPVVQNNSPNDEPQLSPDGQFLAYMSYESGRFEVYVQAFPGPGPRTRVSAEGGGQPRWRRDGGELFYLATDGMLMAVDIRPGAALEPGLPRKLFSTSLDPNSDLDRYAVTADGQRFLVLAPTGEAAASPITVVVNWTAGLPK